MGVVQTDFVGTDAQLQKVMLRIEQQNLKLIELNRRLADESRNAHNMANDGAMRVVGSLASMAAGYFTVQSAVQAVTAALKDQEEQQKRSRDATISQADAQRNMLRNLGDVTPEQQNQFLKQLQEVTTRLAPKGGLTTTYNMAAMGLSASGANREKTLAAVEQALRFAPDNPEAATSIAGAILDMSKATGRSSALENLGYLKYAGEQARVTDWEKIASNLSPAMIGAVQFGATPQEALALVASITQGSADPTGRRSGTATVQFAKQLEDFLPEKDVYNEKYNPLTFRKERYVETRGTGMKTFGERLAYLRSHEKERERFLANASIETKQLAAVRQLAEGPDTMTGKYYAQSLAAAGVPFEKMAESADTKIKQMNQVFEQQIASGERTSTLGKELASTQTPPGRERAINASFTSDELGEMLASFGVGRIGRTMAKSDYWLGRMIESQEDAFVGATRPTISQMRERGRMQYANGELAYPEDAKNAERLQSYLDTKLSMAASQREAAAQANGGDERLIQATEGVREELKGLRGDINKPTPAAIQTNARTSR